MQFDDSSGSDEPLIVMKRTRVEPDDEDSDFEDALVQYVAQRRCQRMKFGYACVRACQMVIDAYVDFRGGVNAVMNFEINDAVFDFDTYCDKLFAQDFRFSKTNVNTIVNMFINVAGIDPFIVSYAGDRAPLRIAFLCMCMKYAWPTRLGKMCQMFGKGTAWISRIIKALREQLYNKFQPRLRNPHVLSAEDIATFTAAVAEKSGLDVCFGFLDGTVRPTCRSTEAQAELYNGKDRTHALKYQCVSTPDGIIRHLDGPWPGRRHDQHMVNSAPISTATAALQNWLLAQPPTPYGTCHVIYADAGYSDAPGIETPWPDASFNLEHAAYNEAMSASRIAVEWEFGHILEHWASHHFKPQQKVLSNQKIGQVYIVCGLLSNMFTCLYPSKTNKYFKVPAPSLGGYLRSMLE
jgi:nuclease HARBI1